jgi:hypothetical protein
VPEIADELGGRVGGPRARRIVGAARRERTAHDGEVGVVGLERVVGRGEQLLVRACCGVIARRAELGQPEQVEVRLVPDDHRSHVGQVARERGGESRELGALRGLERRVGAELVHREHRRDVVVHGSGDGAAQRPLDRRHGRTGLPDRAEHDRAEARVACELHGGDGIGRPLGRVLHRADDEGRWVRGPWVGAWRPAAPRERDER